MAERDYSVDLQKILSASDVSWTAKKTSSKGETPLALLCAREEFQGQIDMMQCLIAIDSSAAVIENAISGCLDGLCPRYWS